MKIRPIFAWYDLWIGVFVDRPKRRVYVFPVPCFGIVIQFDGPLSHPTTSKER
jgi:hypothetical protein